jgi:hypothetical protein
MEQRTERKKYTASVVFNGIGFYSHAYLSASPYFNKPFFGKLISPLPAILKYNFSIVAAIDRSFVFANYFHKKRRAFFEEILQRHFVCYELAKQKASRSKINGALRFAAIARKKKILVVVFQ